MYLPALLIFEWRLEAVCSDDKKWNWFMLCEIISFLVRTSNPLCLLAGILFW